MSSYLPPIKNLTKFNATVFQNQLTDEEIDSEIKTMKLNKLDTFTPSQFIEAKRISPSSSTGTVTFENEFASEPSIHCQAIIGLHNALVHVHVTSASATEFTYTIVKWQNGPNTVEPLVTEFFYQAIGTIQL